MGAFNVFLGKPDFSSKFQFRPILAAYNQASYGIAKFLVPILTPLTTNEYTIQNSAEFTSKLSEIQNADNLYMASFDIENLFTNIPLAETINICIQRLYSNPPPCLWRGSERFPPTS